MDILKTFDEEAGEYDFTSRAVNIYFDESLDELVKNIKAENRKGLKILDVCCGTGILTQKVANRFPDAEIFGVDFSKGMLSVARSRMQGFDFKVLTSDILDREKMKKLPMFDVVVSSFGIHNVHERENKQAALENILPHLRAGGQFIVCDIIRGENAAEQKEFDDFQRDFIRKTYSEKETEDWMKLLAEEDDPETLKGNFELFEGCGLSDVKLLWKREFLTILEAYKK